VRRGVSGVAIAAGANIVAAGATGDSYAALLRGATHTVVAAAATSDIDAALL